VTFELTILGCSSAIPVKGRFLTSQILNIREGFFLIDCGEGTQYRMLDYKIPKSKIENIFISHLHGDHIYGLPGLISSYNLNNRVKPLSIFGPIGLVPFLENALEYSYNHLGFDLNIITVDHNKYSVVFEDDNVKISAFPLKHRIPTVGYKFEEKSRLKNIKPEKISEYNLDYNQIRSAKYGNDVVLKSGEILKNSEVTLPPKHLRSYAYCSDTVYSESYIQYIKNVDLLYHESTYMSNMQEKAKLRGHSTTIDAANIAKKANAGKLILGHYSSRYHDLDPLLQEARSIFKNTELGLDGQNYNIELIENE